MTEPNLDKQIESDLLDMWLLWERGNWYLNDDHPNYDKEHDRRFRDAIVEYITKLLADEVKKARHLERKMMTLQKIDKKLLKSEAQKIEFEVLMTDNCKSKHYCAYSSDGKNFSVTMDGQNIISRNKPTQPSNKSKEQL